MRRSIFSGNSVTEVRRNQTIAMQSEIESYNADKLLNTSSVDLIEYFKNKYSVSPPRIIREKVSVDSQEKSHQTTNTWGDRETVKTIEYILYLPFEGESELFNVSPSSHLVYMQNIEIGQHELVIRFHPHNSNSAAIKQEMDSLVASLIQDVERLSREFEGLTSSLTSLATQCLEARKNKILADRKTVASLGFPLRHRADAPQTYVVPSILRKIEFRPPAASSTSFLPDPTLDMKEYENILDIMYNMALVMERSPTTFASAGEVELRDHFLIQLNGQYEGQATGETFNANGKTDILIRNNGGNVFIAECKFWGGEKQLLETVDQLLSYTTWRDTKTCIVFFNRNRDFGGVLQTIKEQVQKHPNYKRTETYKRTTGSRHIFHHPSDKNKELTTTILAFDILKRND